MVHLKRVGLSKAKADVLAALDAVARGDASRVAHVPRPKGKNGLADGTVALSEVRRIIAGTRGGPEGRGEHEESPHEQIPTIVVHTVKRDGWYIKWFVTPDGIVWFISVHE